jgi:regulator of protease activity HflC (stomatin/prohibitin superfamily)
MDSSNNPIPFDLTMLPRILGSAGVWVAAALVLFCVLLVSTIRIGEVTGEEVGLLLHRISGKLEVIPRSGVTLYNGLTTEFYTLDKTIQTLNMSEDPNSGERRVRDDLKIKTIDGSDVYVDLKVQYRIMPEMAKEVILSSGTGDAYKMKWARDYVRSIVRDHIGELSTEECYDSAKRQVKLANAQKEINTRMERFGIRFDVPVIPRRPRFYAEYETMIKNKKLADQAVQQEASEARAAKQKQETLIIQETNKKNVAVEQYSGKMRQAKRDAEAEADRGKKGASAYFQKVTINATATLYQMEKQAEGIFARKQAEADGIMALRKALEGEGGRNMVKMEYAKKLGEIKFSAKPVMLQGQVERFEHFKGGAASVGK